MPTYITVRRARGPAWNTVLPNSIRQGLKLQTVGAFMILAHGGPTTTVASGLSPSSPTSCICGGRQSLWGTPPGLPPEGIGDISFRLSGDAFLELRDPLGRWIHYVEGSDEYRSEIPGSEAIRHAPNEGCEEMSDDSVSLADTMSMGGDWSEDRIRIPGPSEGEYLMRVKHKPGQDVLLMVDYIGIRESGSSDVMGLTSSADSVSTYRLRLDLAAETPVQIESLHPGDSVATRAARVQLRLPCEPDSFDSIPAANASIELLCKGTPTLTVTMPDGDNSYSVGPVWTEGGKHVTSAYSPHPTIGFVGARRDRYLVAVKATVTGMHVVTVSRTLPGGATFTRADSMSIPAGDTRYWHTSWSEPGKRHSPWIQLERGPVPNPPIVGVSSTILSVGAEPAVSTDGQKLVFVRGSELWLMDLTTGQRTRLGVFRNPHWPAWSPDGRRILFQAERVDRPPGTFAIWTMGIDGKKARETILLSERSDQYPMWSPRGDRIVWTRGHQLWIADSSGARARPLTRHAARVFERACEWSERDDEILYAASDGACDGPQYRLRRVRPDGAPGRSFATEIRAEDARAIPGRSAVCTTNGRRIVVAEEVQGSNRSFCSPTTEPAASIDLASPFHRTARLSSRTATPLPMASRSSPSSIFQAARVRT
jgi:hypothetical protein